MAHARFSIGIDLGTTNSALAFVPLQGEARSEVLEVPQWGSFSGLTISRTLPSFLYLPEEDVAAQLRQGDARGGEWVVGHLARSRAGETPGRVARSAKSWLCHHAADRSAPFLPWGSEDIPRHRKISPIRASALILNFLRAAWDARFGQAGEDFLFDAQEITVTVPASFDAVAQRLTLTAAQEAGFPESARLLEEPQAAFYCWLEQHDSTELRRRLQDRRAGAHHVLVVDVGGGTSDFSLFEVRGEDGGGGPKIKRLAVSDHILLGGDNIDLALAHLLEQRLAGGGKLSGTQWDHLVTRCRDLKEKALSGEGPPDQTFPIAIPGRGSSLIAGSLSAQLTRAEIDGVLLDGFFPECDAEDRPWRTQAALREWGLPYASDSAVTRHLADFLKDRPAVDAVLFNGGSLYPPALRQRLCRLIGKWQDGFAPFVLENAEPDLAVARGAALFGKVLFRRAERIESAAAHAVFLEAHRRVEDDAGREQSRRSLVCILPRGAAAEQTFEIGDLGLELRVGRPVRFQTYYSTRHGRSKAGDVLDGSAADLHPFPPLQTVVKADGIEAGQTVPVALCAKLTELGLLRVSCHSMAPEVRQSWPLEFNLRAHERADPASRSEASTQTAPNAEPEVMEAARSWIEAMLSRPANARSKLSANRVLQSLEKITGLSKAEWNGSLVRALWPPLDAVMACRKLSIEHEETWLILAGYLLRPGFGAPLDDARMDGLWRVRDRGLCFPNKRIKLQEYILWRRVAGGLSRERQERVLAGELDRLRSARGNPPAELVRLAGSFERIGHDLKSELVGLYVARAAALARDRKHCAAYLAALSLLLNRAPLYAGPETVVGPDLVESAYEAFSGLDWADPELSEMQTLFLRSARVVDDRSLDLPRGLRHRIAARLEKAGVSPLKTARIRDFMPVDRSERSHLFGESLPPGLLIGGG